MTALQHDCRERQREHDRIADEVDAWVRDNHRIEVIPFGTITRPPDSFNGGNDKFFDSGEV